MSFRRYFLLYTDYEFKSKDTSERIRLFNEIEAFASHFPSTLKCCVNSLDKFAVLENRDQLFLRAYTHLEKSLTNSKRTVPSSKVDLWVGLMMCTGAICEVMYCDNEFVRDQSLAMLV